MYNSDGTSPVQLYAEAYAEYRLGHPDTAAELLARALGAEGRLPILDRNVNLFFTRPVLRRSIEHAVAVGEKRG